MPVEEQSPPMLLWSPHLETGVFHLPMATFIPAARFHLLTPCYDAFVRLFFGRAFRRMATLIAPQPGQKILDVGCGPGNFIIALHRVQPQTVFTGLDIDPAILNVARAKLLRHGMIADLLEASATNIPLPGPFDIITSTLMFHHLNREQKAAMLRQVFRLLKPGGKLYLYDFAPPREWLGKILASVYRHFEDIEDGITGAYPTMVETAGLRVIATPLRSRFLALLEAEKPR